MTEESILRAVRKQIDELIPILGNGLSYNEFVDEIIVICRDAMQKARREVLRGN
jgi:hypothetical protein